MENNRASGVMRNVIFLLVLGGAVAAYYMFKNQPADSYDHGKPAEEVAEAEAVSESGLLDGNTRLTEDSWNEVVDNLNTMTYCLNRFSDRTFSSFQYYDMWVDLEKGPTGKERNIYGLYELYDPEDCLDQLEVAEILYKQNPFLASKASLYREALENAVPVLAEAYEYYDHKDYLDDQMKKGQEMHPEVVRAFRNYALADERLREMIDSIQENNYTRWLESPVSENSPTRRDLVSVMLSARSLMKMAETDESKFQLDTFTRELEVFDGLLDQLKDAPKDSEGPLTQSYFSSFEGQAKDFQKNAKAFMRRIRDKKPYSNWDRDKLGSTSEWMLEGSPGQMNYSYNRALGTFNNLSFSDYQHLRLLESTLFFKYHQDFLN